MPNNTPVKTREEESRDAQIRRNLKMFYQSPLSVSKDSVADHLEVAWFNDSVMSTPTPHVLEDAQRRGWEPVTVEEMPHMVSHLKSDDRARKGTPVRYRELILHKRLKEYGDIERAALKERADAAFNKTPGQDHLMNEPTMPMRVFQNDTSRSKGANL